MWNLARGVFQLIAGTIALLVVVDTLVSSERQRLRPRGLKRAPTQVSTIPIAARTGAPPAPRVSGQRTAVPWQLTLFAGLAPVALTAGTIIWQRVRSPEERFSFELPGMAGTLQWLIIGTVGGVVLGIIVFRMIAARRGVANQHR